MQSSSWSWPFEGPLGETSCHLWAEVRCHCKPEPVQELSVALVCQEHGRASAGPVWAGRRARFPREGRVHWLCSHSSAKPLSLHIPLPRCAEDKSKVLNPAQSSRQMQSPSPAPPDLKTLTFTPAPPPLSSSHLPVFFLFLAYCVASRQSLHVFP